MRISVHYMAQLRQAAGVGSELWEVESPCFVPDLLRRVAAKHGEGLERFLLDAAGNVQRTVLIFVGDEQVGTQENSPLRDGDVVTLLSPIAGG